MRPRDSLEPAEEEANELGTETCAPLPVKSFEMGCFRAGAGKAACVGGAGVFSKAGSEIGDANLFVEFNFGASAGLCADPSLLCKLEVRTAGSFFFDGGSLDGDMSTIPATSSKVGAPVEGTFRSFTGTAGREGMAGAGGCSTCEACGGSCSRRRQRLWKRNAGYLQSLVNPPKIDDRLNKFDFNVALDAGKIASTHNAADHVPPLLIRKDDRLSGRKRIRQAKYPSVIENNDGPALFSCRAGGTGGIAIRTRQTSDNDRNLEANWIRSRGLSLACFQSSDRASRAWTFRPPRWDL